MDKKQKELNKIERRNKILLRNKTSKLNFVPKWQYDYIREHFKDISSFILNNYNPNINDYKDYNNQLITIYDYFQNDNNLKYLMTRFFNLSSACTIRDSRIDKINDTIMSMLKIEDKDRNLFNELFAYNNHPTIFLRKILHPLRPPLYWVLDKVLLNYFFAFLNLMKQSNNYDDFRYKSWHFLDSMDYSLPDYYHHLDLNFDYKQLKDE